MININVNNDDSIKILKNFIQDLSFENPQNVEDNNSVNNNNNNININMNVIFKPYKNNRFSLILKFTLNCSSKKNKKILFNLELDYFGFFEILRKKNFDQEEFTKKGIKLLFPFVKEIVEDILKKGGNVSISLNEVEYNLIKN